MEAPPRKGERTRRQILETAVDIASAEGLEGLTIGRLSGELGLSKAGLFAHFGSKEHLQLAAVEAARDVFVREIVVPASAAPRGVARLQAMIERWVRYIENPLFRGGCFFFAASAEFDDRPGAVHDRVSAMTGAWLNALEDEAREARDLGQLRSTVDPAQLAFEIHAFVQEANWASRLLRMEMAFVRARRSIRERLGSALTASGRKALGDAGLLRLRSARKPAASRFRVRLSGKERT